MPYSEWIDVDYNNSKKISKKWIDLRNATKSTDTNYRRLIM